jgi:hypothetical protein
MMDHVSTTERAAKDAPPKLKAKASNSIFSFPGNGRSAGARRFRDLLVGMLRDLGLTESQLADSLKMQLRSAALTAVQIEGLQARAMKGEAIDVWSLVRQQNLLNRMLWQIGLGRRRRTTLTPEAPLDYAARQKEQAGA